jgi:N6-adenosine-specific RNA methylase IME4
VREDPRLLRRYWKVRALRLPLVRTLEADPPWKFKGASRRGGVSWRGRYQPMGLEAIMRYPLPPLADDCRLFLWRVGAMQDEALAVIKAWGFTLKSEIIWVKTTADGMLMIDVDGIGNDEVLKGKRDLAARGIIHHGDLANLAFGAGHQTRYAHETCLIATRGNPGRDEHFRSVMFAPRGEHSEKPAKFYDIVDRMSPGPRHRMFAMGPRPGWTSEYHMAHRGDYAQAA